VEWEPVAAIERDGAVSPVQNRVMRDQRGHDVSYRIPENLTSKKDAQRVGFNNFWESHTNCVKKDYFRIVVVGAFN